MGNTLGVEGQVPPYSQDAEIAVLGSILLDDRVIRIVDGIIEPSDFYIEAHRRIFEAMRGLVVDGIAVDYVTLGNRLKVNGDLEKIGGVMALSGLTDAVATSVNVEHYAGIVREAAAIRKVIYAAQTTVSSSFAANNTAIVADSVTAIVEASHYLARTRMPTSMFGLADGVVELYKKVASGYRGVPLPWPTLDTMTAGMWSKTLTMFVARPGTGKTFIAVIAGRHAWLENNRVLIVSPEMSKEEIAERFFVIEAGVSYRDVIHGQLSDFALPLLENVVAKASSMDNLWIMDAEDDLSPKGIEAAIRACRPHLVCIDSIYDLKIRGSRQERAIGALEWMKGAAKRLDFACCGFAQQNRTAELSERKGGGSRLGTIALADEIGQDAHAVFALEQSKDDKADKVLKIRPLKLRRGQMSRDLIRCNWDFDQMSYSEIEEDDEEYADNETIPF